MEKKKRFNILLGKTDYERLQNLQRDQGTSGSMIFRKMLLNHDSMDKGKKPVCANGESCLCLDRWQKQRGS